MDVKGNVPWNGDDITKCVSKGGPVDRVLNLGLRNPDSITRWPVMIRTCLKDKSGSTGNVVLQHVTVINRGENSRLCNYVGVFCCGDNIIDSILAPCFVGGPGINGALSKAGGTMRRP